MIPNLGIGVGFRLTHYKEIIDTFPPVDWFEIISENYLDMQGQQFECLERILDSYPVVMHGVSLNIGSPDPLDFDYLKKLKALARRTKSPWVSDHISWGKLEGAHYHDLMPLPFTRETVGFVAERARIVQDYLEVPFALENISSYVSYAQDEMPEWEFYRAIVEQANVHMMLDVNNIYVSSQNLKFSAQEYIDHLPLERVIQIHLAGHTVQGEFLIDTHDNRVCDAVWELYGAVYPRTRGVSTLLEWDEQLLSFADTLKEAMKAKSYQNALCERIP